MCIRHYELAGDIQCHITLCLEIKIICYHSYMCVLYCIFRMFWELNASYSMLKITSFCNQLTAALVKKYLPQNKTSIQC